MKKQNLDDLEHEMKQHLKAGRKWVVFEGEELPDKYSLCQYFPSALDAAKFCSENFWRKDSDGEMVELSYGYHAVENLLKEVRFEKGKWQPLLVAPATMETHLKELSITPYSLIDPHKAFIELAFGRIMMGSKIRSLTPMKEAESFHIVKHMHDYKGLIYELGHSHHLVSTYPDYENAVQALGEYAQHLPRKELNSSTELVLICQFSNQQLSLDMEGSPINNCGLSLSTASYINDELSINHFCNPRSPLLLSQQFFIKYDNQKGALIFLDDQLREINPDNTLQSFAPFSFRTMIADKLLQSVIIKARRFSGPDPTHRPDQEGPGEGRHHGGGLRP